MVLSKLKSCRYLDDQWILNTKTISQSTKEQTPKEMNAGTIIKFKHSKASSGVVSWTTDHPEGQKFLQLIPCPTVEQFKTFETMGAGASVQINFEVTNPFGIEIRVTTAI